MSNFPNNVNPKHSGLSRRAVVVVLSISIVLLIPLLATVWTDDNARSKWEKRNLESFPEWHGLAAINEYFDKISEFADDHIGLALEFNQIYRKILFYIFGDSPVKNITVGRSGFVYLNSHTPKRKNIVYKNLCIRGASSSHSLDVIDRVEKVFKYFASSGLNVSLGVAITKPVLYPEFLPVYIPTPLRKACSSFRDDNFLVSIQNKMELNGGTYYYPYEMFFQQKNVEAFYPKENFHWSGRSSHVFAKGLLNQIGIEVSPAFSVGEKLTTGRSDLNPIGFERAVNVWHYPYQSYGVSKTTVARQMVMPYYSRIRDVSYYKTESPMSDRKLLLLSNSFGAYVAPHLAPGFKELYHVNLNHLQKDEYKRFFNEFINSLSITDVMFIVHDDGLINSWGKKLIRELNL
ncbi:MAG: hypothetical protein ACI82S_002896 [Patiriisocius sp.]|jgi:hypothetical protein